jgi:hypothetical protein
LQTKWFLTGVISFLLLSGLISWLAGATLGKSSGFLGDIDELLALIIPVTIAIAILRYRLWDIDVIIRRTLVYSILTAFLVLVYFGCVTILQIIFSAFTSEKSTSAIVISTLAIAALFNPLRIRIQTFIDRRFYRSKSDAQKTLEGFASSARNEADLDRSTAELLWFAQSTTQPRNLSLWMKADGKP